MHDVNYKIGDSRQILPTLASGSFHLVITSPPYWNAKDYGTDQIGFGQSYQDYVANLNDIWKECVRLLVPNGKIAIDIQPLPASSVDTGKDRSSIVDIMRDVANFMLGEKMDLSNIFIWDKRKYNNQRIFGSYPYPPNLYSHISFEYIYVFRKHGESRRISQDIKAKSKITQKEWEKWCFNSIWDIPPVIKVGSEGELTGHIAPFPLEIPRRLIRLFSFVGDNVLDPFVGSGTTLAACKLEQRRGLGIEIQPSYEPLIQLYMRNPHSPPSMSQVEEMKINRSIEEF